MMNLNIYGETNFDELSFFFFKELSNDANKTVFFES